MIQNTYIFNPVRPDFIYKAIGTLYLYTDMSNSKVIVVDQTADGLDFKGSRETVHLHIRPHRNLGFSKSMNEGIIHALRWGSKYITCANDDVEYINKKWWDGILTTFEDHGDRCLAVNPESPRIPLWGYGRPHGEYVDIIKHKLQFSDEDYQYLLDGNFHDTSKFDLHSDEEIPKTFPKEKRGVIDAIATWHTTFKADAFNKIGLFDERYYPGGGEDYDLNARAYREKYRMVGTTKSWVWHWWGSSKDKQGEVKDAGLPIIDKLRWNKGDLIWPPEKNHGQSMDPWGKWTDEDGNKHPLYRDPEIAIMEI